MQKTRLPQTITERLVTPDVIERLATLTTGYTPDREQELQEPTYYDYPVFKQPFWGWEIILYFFFGGLPRLLRHRQHRRAFGSPEDRVVARTGYYLSLLAVLPCPILLIKDLGRPERFLNMLRLFKVKSPMSMGVWGLLSFSLFSGITAVIQAAERWSARSLVGSQHTRVIATTSPCVARNSVRRLSWRLYRRPAHSNQRTALVTQQNARRGICLIRHLHQFRPHLTGVTSCKCPRTFIAQTGTSRMGSITCRNHGTLALSTWCRSHRPPL